MGMLHTKYLRIGIAGWQYSRTIVINEDRDTLSLEVGRYECSHCQTCQKRIASLKHLLETGKATLKHSCNAIWFEFQFALPKAEGQWANVLTKEQKEAVLVFIREQLTKKAIWPVDPLKAR